MRSWINQLQEAYEGEIALNQAITRNMQKYDVDASRLAATSRPPLADYAQILTVADLMKVLDTYVDKLSQSDSLPPGPALTLLSRLKSQNLDRTAQQLDQITKMPQPQEKTTP